MNLRKPVATAIAGLLAVLLAACSPATAPEFSPSAPFEPARTESVASPSPTKTPSPTAEPSPNAVIEIPDSAYLEDLQGAIDVATLYVTLHPALYQGGQGGERNLYGFLTHYACEICNEILASTSMRVAYGEIRHGGDITVSEQFVEASLGATPLGDPQASVVFDIVEEPYTTVNEDGAVIASSEGGTYRVAMELRYSNGLWQVSGIADA